MVLLRILGKSLEQLVVSLYPLDVCLFWLVAIFLKHLVAIHLRAAKQLGDVLVGLGAGAAATSNGDPPQRAHAISDHGERVLERRLAVGLADLIRLLHRRLQVLQEAHDGVVIRLLGLVGNGQERALRCECALDGLGLRLDDGAQFAAQIQPCLQLGVDKLVECSEGRGQALDDLRGGCSSRGGCGGGAGGDCGGGARAGNAAVRCEGGRGDVLKPGGGSFEPVDYRSQHSIWPLLGLWTGPNSSVLGLAHGRSRGESGWKGRQRGTHRFIKVVKLFILFWAMAAGKVHLVQGRYYGQELGELADCGHLQLVCASCTLPIEICGAGGHQEGSCYV